MSAPRPPSSACSRRHWPCTIEDLASRRHCAMPRDMGAAAWGREWEPPPLEKVRRQGPWEGTAACAVRKAGSWRMASHRRETGTQGRGGRGGRAARGRAPRGGGRRGAPPRRWLHVVVEQRGRGAQRGTCSFGGTRAVRRCPHRAPTTWCCKSPWAAATDSWASSSPPFPSPPRRTRCSRPGLTHRSPQGVAPPWELDTTALVHPGLFTKAVLAASGAEVVIGEVEHSSASWSGTAAPPVSR
ncbi:hypothetical protein PVAP13_7NG203534 [Panicum virgatum]|uniref:Uncharacterized protein n=1 Tax=Panicum virgatum TaxID=38727 RepID=A0A8T0Q7A9_PANVG|nr:hypothetical protein PVAP13_7NG203534 [Panicum virgatum]